MKKYDSYKDSGIEWIGKIPEHWEVIKFSLFIKIRHGHQFMNYDFTEDGVKIIKITQLHKNGYLDLSNCSFIKNERVKEFNNILIKEKDILMCLTGGTIGKIIRVGMVNEPLLQNYRVGHFSSAVNNKICDDFIFWVMSSEYLVSQIFFQMRETGQPNIGMDDFGRMKISVPSTNEQTQIANYLDHKTTQIDTLISKKEQFITLLQEERIAVINQAVTKGLDQKVKMKDSGIEWLGEIPEHWEVKKLKYIKSNIKNAFVDGPFGSNLKTEHFVENGDVYVIDSGLITSGIFHKKREMKTITNDHFETVLRSECKQNDIIIAKIGANFGMSGILPKLDKPSLVSGNTLKLTVNEQIYDLKLIHLQLLNLKTSGEIDLLVKGSAQPALSMGVMSDLPFAIPSTLGEQVEIRNYILNQHKRIDELIFKSKQEIELLKEYKTALISEVVTGKVDVRDVVLN